jgi:hypothetical protein
MPYEPLTEEEAETRLAEELQRRHLANCLGCGKKIDRGDVAWNTGQTEYGTPYSYVEIQCLNCQTEIGSYHTWYEIETFSELVESTLNDWK